MLLDPAQSHGAQDEHLRLFQLGLLILDCGEGRHVELVVLPDLDPVGRCRNLLVREGNGRPLHVRRQMLPDVLGGGRLGLLGGGEEDLDDDDILDVGRDAVTAVGFRDLVNTSCCQHISKAGYQCGKGRRGRVTHVVASTQRIDCLSVDIWRPQLAVDKDRQGLEDSSQNVQAGGDGAGVDEGIFKVGVAREQLRLQEACVGDVLEEGDVHAVRGGHVLDGDGLEEGHVDGTKSRTSRGSGFDCFLTASD